MNSENNAARVKIGKLGFDSAPLCCGVFIDNDTKYDTRDVVYPFLLNLFWTVSSLDIEAHKTGSTEAACKTSSDIKLLEKYKLIQPCFFFFF